MSTLSAGGIPKPPSEAPDEPIGSDRPHAHDFHRHPGLNWVAKSGDVHKAPHDWRKQLAIFRYTQD